MEPPKNLKVHPLTYSPAKDHTFSKLIIGQ